MFDSAIQACGVSYRLGGRGGVELQTTNNKATLSSIAVGH